MDKIQEENIDALYRQMHDFLYAYAMSVLCDPELALEAVQETFVIACRKPAELLSSKNPQGYIVNTLRNVMRNELRTRARLSRLILRNAEMSTFASDADPSAHGTDPLLGYEGSIPPDELELIRMAVLDGMSMAEIAKKLGISVSAVKKRLQRAREKLREIEKNQE